MIHRNGRKLFEKVKNDFMEQYTFPTDTNELESYKPHWVRKSCV